MRRLAPVLLTLTVLSAAACNRDAASVGPTSPKVQVRAVTTAGVGPCTGQHIIYEELAQIFPDGYLADETSNAAEIKFAGIVEDCSSNNASAREQMMNLVQYSIDEYKGPSIPDDEEMRGRIVVLWNDLFAFVGYPTPDVPEVVLTSAGAAGVIGQTTPEPFRELKADFAADSIPVQDADGDQRTHLFVIYPITDGCLDTNLKQSGRCYEFSAFPTVSPKWHPLVKFGICQAADAGDAISLSEPALGHTSNSATLITLPGGTYPQFCPDADDIAQGSWNGGFGQAARRLAWLTKRAVSPSNLYAVHGGLGGLGGTMSPYGGVALRVFGETFDDAPLGNLGDATLGSWFKQINRSGTITVQSALGQYASKLLVLNQGGGNCVTCGGLVLRANFAEEGQHATEGVYDVEWTSLQDKTNMSGDAPFVIRDHTGLEIARVTYSQVKVAKKEVNRITWNAGTTAIATWVAHVPQNFKIRVDLNTNKTALWINGAPIASNVNFVNTGAVDLASLAAEFSGQDNGVLGWDNIVIHRLPDEVQ